MISVGARGFEPLASSASRMPPEAPKPLVTQASGQSCRSAASTEFRPFSDGAVLPAVLSTFRQRASSPGARSWRWIEPRNSRRRVSERRESQSIRFGHLGRCRRGPVRPGNGRSRVLGAVELGCDASVRRPLAARVAWRVDDVSASSVPRGCRAKPYLRRTEELPALRAPSEFGRRDERHAPDHGRDGPDQAETRGGIRVHHRRKPE
jgi:hypothetical protein